MGNSPAKTVASKFSYLCIMMPNWAFCEIKADSATSSLPLFFLFFHFLWLFRQSLNIFNNLSLKIRKIQTLRQSIAKLGLVMKNYYSRKSLICDPMTGFSIFMTFLDRYPPKSENLASIARTCKMILCVCRYAQFSLQKSLTLGKVKKRFLIIFWSFLTFLENYPPKYEIKEKD